MSEVRKELEKAYAKIAHMNTDDLKKIVPINTEVKMSIYFPGVHPEIKLWYTENQISIRLFDFDKKVVAE